MTRKQTASERRVFQMRIRGIRDVLRVSTPELSQVLDVPFATLQGWLLLRNGAVGYNLRKVEHLEYLIDAGYRVRPDLTLYKRYTEKFGVGDGSDLELHWEDIA